MFAPRRSALFSRQIVRIRGDIRVRAGVRLLLGRIKRSARVIGRLGADVARVGF
jgi:hypothetical protein